MLKRFLFDWGKGQSPWGNIKQKKAITSKTVPPVAVPFGMINIFQLFTILGKNWSGRPRKGKKG